MDTFEDELREALQDDELRAEYGASTLKYNFAFALSEARKLKNLTQTALARIAGVSQAYIAKLESGEANPTIGRVGAILASIWLKPEIEIVPLLADERQEHSISGFSSQAETIVFIPRAGLSTAGDAGYVSALGSSISGQLGIDIYLGESSEQRGVLNATV